MAGTGNAAAGKHDARAFQLALVVPAVTIMLLLGLFPLLYSVVVSFQRIGLTTTDTSFAGFVNYVRLFSDARFFQSLGHTLLIGAIALPVQLVLGLLLAFHFLHDRRGKRVFVALLIIPAVISPMVAGSMWRLMFDERYGPINQIIGWIAGEWLSILWTIDPRFAYPAIIICDVWQWTPFMFLILLAALSNVDVEQQEAAALDGASRWQAFWHVTLPAIMPILSVALLIRSLDLIRVFDIVWQLTRGGPGTSTETLSIYAYIRGFQEFDTSFVGALVVVLIIGLSAILMLALRRLEVAR